MAFIDRSHQPLGMGRIEPDAGLDPLAAREPLREGAAPVRPHQRLELVGTFLRAEGAIDLGRFGRLSDYVNFLSGFFTIRDVTLLSRIGQPTRVVFPELRIRLADIALVAQREEAPLPHAGPMAVIPKQRRRLVVMTEAHIVYGSVFLHEEGSLSAFMDSPDPHFIPMTGVRVRWLTDRRLAGRFSFALLQRSHIVGVASELGRDAPGTERRAFDPTGPGLAPDRKLASGF